MNCIFCKSDSSNSRSTEHIVPESLGNKEHTLPPGVVCDKCNNYFATKVEKYFLESDAIKSLRFEQMIKSKRNRIPPVDGFVSAKYPAKIFKKITDDYSFDFFLETNDAGLKHLQTAQQGNIYIPYNHKPPDKFLTSRFLAKMALELLADRLFKAKEDVQYIINEEQLDPIRYHAREGRIRKWPFYERRIYPANRHFKDKNGKLVQTLFELDILVTEKNEYYFIFALFGIELTINIGGPELEGYEKWLEKNNYVSPLYIN
ncbi:HNH endonuclease [Gracilimonas sp.]|jgi:hypothetical protein|uniref:HNH endonuclease n=1 Tax=Gracilimonas sp. TaxID=1974203 RepID=UPI003BA89F45